jgi:hypothetical protein
MPCNIWTQIMNDTKDTKLIYSILYELLYTKQRQGLVSAVRSTGPLPASLITCDRRPHEPKFAKQVKSIYFK